jgi:hypothetical protein
MEVSSLHFLDVPVQVVFDSPPARSKTPGCPDGFIWEGKGLRVVELLSEWHDFSRRGRRIRNMRPAHARVAAGRGSLGVGRFHFRVRVETGRVFELYYDRAPVDADHRKGQWFLYCEVMH